MTYPVADLTNLQFANFNASQINGLVNLLDQGQFTPVSDWAEMPAGVKPMTYTFGQDVGNKYAVISGYKDDCRVQAYIGEQHLYVPYTSGSNNSHPYHSMRDSNNTLMEWKPAYFLYVEVDLPFTAPHIRVHPAAKVPVKSLANASAASLEGDFDRYFTVETVSGQTVKAFELLPPNRMIRLLEVTPDVQLEFQGDKLFIRLPLPQPFFNVSTSTSFFGAPEVRTVKFKDTWETFSQKLSTVFESVPEFVKSARTAAISPETFELIQGKWNTVNERVDSPEEVQSKTAFGRILLIAIPVLLAAGIGAAAFSSFANMSL